MTNRCSACGKFCANIDGVRCMKCNVLLHKQCTNISPNSRSNGKYLCKSCKSKPQKATETADYVDDTEAQNSSSPLQHEIKLLRAEISHFRSEMAEMFTFITDLGKRLDSIEERVSKLEEQPTELQSQISQNSEVVTAVEQLKNRLNDSEQQQLLNDVCISGVTESSAENLVHVVVSLANKLSLKLDEKDIVSVQRIGAQQDSQDSNADQAAVASTDRGARLSRPRPIAVRLTRRHLRDEFLRAARVRRGADTAGTGIGGAVRRFYVNERLTRYHSRLFYLTRERAAAENWRYVWTRNGRRYARRDSKAICQRIRCEDDIGKIFGSA